MIRRKCPECKNRTLKIPLISSDYICRKCISVFRVSWYSRLVAIALQIFLFYGLFRLSITLLGSQNISLIEFGALLYVVIPLFGAFVVALIVKYFGPLTLGGVKGARRKIS